MKKILFIATILTLCFIVPSFAQETNESNASSTRSSVYPYRVDVVKILSNTDGYIVKYFKANGQIADAYISKAWFKAGGKASMIKAKGSYIPYMVVYFKEDGAFSHVKIFASAYPNDASWGLEDGDFSSNFSSDDLKMEF